MTDAAHHSASSFVAGLRRLLAKTEAQVPRHDLPAASPPGPRKRVTLGMATFDDFDGVYFTIQAFRLYHPEVLDQVEILLVDNHPEGVAAPSFKGLERQIPNYRYVPFRSYRSTAVRDVIFREAQGDFVLCVDAHVLLAPGSMRRLLAYLDANPGSGDLLQGPLVLDDLASVSTHFNPEWRSAMFGTWATDPRGLEPDAEPFEIPMQGLGLFGCFRDTWPGFNPRFRGFGGEEGYLHEKFRQAGRRTLCLPFLRWVHRFWRPLGAPYELISIDRIRNYLIGWRELGLDSSEVIAHFGGILGESGSHVLAEAEADVAHPLAFFDAVYAIHSPHCPEQWDRLDRQITALGIGWLIRRIEETPGDPHQAVLAEAQRLGLRHVLVLEDDVTFAPAARRELESLVARLAGSPWERVCLGPGVVETGRAVAYSQSSYQSLLREEPEAPTTERLPACQST